MSCPTLSARAYDGILRLYPSDLRREFGPEMNELFVEDLDDAWRSSGLVGVIGVWWCALCELFRIALPAQSSNPAFAVPAIAALYVLGMIGELAAIRDPMTDQWISAVIAGPNLLTGLAAIVVVHTGNVRVISLDLKCSKSAI
jgi:hypothetical protein